MHLININLIPDHILVDLRERGLTDFDITNSLASTLLDEYLSWHGIIGWTPKIIEAMKAFAHASMRSGREDDVIKAAAVAMMDEDEKLKAIHSILSKGGGQAVMMAHLWIKSDSLNRRRFEEAFPHLFLNYRE